MGSSTASHHLTRVAMVATSDGVPCRVQCHTPPSLAKFVLTRRLRVEDQPEVEGLWLCLCGGGSRVVCESGSGRGFKRVTDTYGCVMDTHVHPPSAVNTCVTGHVALVLMCRLGEQVTCICTRNLGKGGNYISNFWSFFSTCLYWPKNAFDTPRASIDSA